MNFKKVEFADANEDRFPQSLARSERSERLRVSVGILKFFQITCSSSTHQSGSKSKVEFADANEDRFPQSLARSERSERLRVSVGILKFFQITCSSSTHQSGSKSNVRQERHKAHAGNFPQAAGKAQLSAAKRSFPGELAPTTQSAVGSGAKNFKSK